MATVYKILPNQNITDAILMATGTIESAMQVMFTNDISISDDTATEEIIYLPEGLPTDSDTLKYFKQEGIVIGTKGQ